MNQLRSRILKTRLVGALRVLGLLVFVHLIAVGLWLRSAHARASEALLSAGAELMKVEGANPSQPARSVFLNGMKVHLRTATTKHDLHSVLDRFHVLCRGRTGVEAPQAVLDKLRGDTVTAISPPLLDGVLRAESGSEGIIACIDTGTRLSLAELTSRLQAFVKSGDLNEVGEFRYVLARRVDDKTVVLTLWSEGSTPLLKMFPSVGDAPGQDPGDLPRPPGMRRLLSTWENGQPYSMTAYVAPAGKETSLVAFYENDLHLRGWALQTKVGGKGEAKVAVITARRSARTVVVRIGRGERGEAAVAVGVLG